MNRKRKPLKHRSAAALAAKLRHAGPMADRRTRRQRTRSTQKRHAIAESCS